MSSNTMRFENLLEAVPDALVGMDQKGIIRFVNRQTESLFGYERSQLIGKFIEALVPETLWSVYSQHQEDYFADPRTRSSGLDLVLTGRHHNGGEFPINVSLSHIDTGDVLLVITGARDVTLQQQAVRNASLIEAVVECSDDAIISATLQGTIMSWNPAAQRMYGYSSKEIIGRSIALLTPERAGDTAEVQAGINVGLQVERLETIRVRKDGTAVPVAITVAPMRDAGGEVVGLSAVHRDVTEQRKAFEAAQRMAAIVENCDDAIIGRDLDGIITSWNPAAERLYGYASDEIVGRPIDLFVPEDQVDEAETIIAKIKAGKQIEHLELDRFKKDGTVVTVSLTVSPIRDAEGALVGTSVIHREMSRSSGLPAKPTA